MRTTRPKAPRDGFTLIEMATVIGIIGILLSFILAVSFQGLQVARVRATQSLITKLSVAMEERLDALLALPVTPNGTHQWLASINPAGISMNGNSPNSLPWGLTSEQRAYVIARLDQIRAEIPDVFFIDFNNGNYPINFCALPFPLNAQNPTAANYVLPLGNTVPPGYTPSATPPSVTGYTTVPGGQLDPDGDGFANIGPGNLYTGANPAMPVVNRQGTGIYGAAYSAAASLYRLAGYTPYGTDGIDNDGNGLVDDQIQEGYRDSNGGQNNVAQQAFATFKNNHTHKTARAEMLYALLVNGQGPLGSVFEREDFSDNEVKDTDQDGVPEFVDAWGEPLQFYRWPVYHNSAQAYVNQSGTLNATGLQKGLDYYMDGPLESRQTNPLDPDRQLTALAWWNDPSNFGTISPKAIMVQNYFMPLQEDLPSWTLAHATDASPPPTPGVGQCWDRAYAPAATGVPNERAYFCKFLITSSGPGLVPGYYITPDTTIRSSTSADLLALQILVGKPASGIPAESRAPYYFDPTQNTDPPGQDDIDSQNIQARSGGMQ